MLWQNNSFGSKLMLWQNNSFGSKLMLWQNNSFGSKLMLWQNNSSGIEGELLRQCSWQSRPFLVSCRLQVRKIILPWVAFQPFPLLCMGFQTNTFACPSSTWMHKTFCCFEMKTQTLQNHHLYHHGRRMFQNSPHHQTVVHLFGIKVICRNISRSSHAKGSFI